MEFFLIFVFCLNWEESNLSLPLMPQNTKANGYLNLSENGFVNVRFTSWWFWRKHLRFGKRVDSKHLNSMSHQKCWNCQGFITNFNYSEVVSAGILFSKSFDCFKQYTVEKNGSFFQFSVYHFNPSPAYCLYIHLLIAGQPPPALRLLPALSGVLGGGGMGICHWMKLWFYYGVPNKC